MSFASQEAMHQKDGLEDRLRGLILNNAQSASLGLHTTQDEVATPVPPHMRGASDAEQQEYMRRQTARPERQQTSTVSQQPPQGGKKRPNQAQRRQMNSQFSIPIDTVSGSKGQSGPGFSPSIGFSSPARQYGPSNGQSNQGLPQWQQHFPRSQNSSPTVPQHSQLQFQQPLSQFPTYQTHMQPQKRSLYQPPPALIQSRVPKTIPPPPPQEQQWPQMSHQYGQRHAPQHTQLYQPGPYGGYGRGSPFGASPEQVAIQSAFLETLINQHVPRIGISESEIAEKEEFRKNVEQICRAAIVEYEQMELYNANFDPTSVELRCFGSMASGFATKSSDMDLALLTPHSKPPPDSSESLIPRLLEKKLLDAGYGARLLTRTRVPIIKLCQKPTARLISDLLEERKKWENGFTAKVLHDDGEIVVGKEANRKVNTKDCDKPDRVTEENIDKSPTAIYNERIALLHQKPNQCLGDYYGSAKRLLRKLGGRDIGAVYDTEPSQDEIKILTDVCRAFLNGLSDEGLKARLCTYQSLAFPTAEQPTNPRSLSGIFTQMEGEQLAMSWEKRPLREASDKVDLECGRQIEDWQKLQNRTDLEASVHNRMLHQALERLKRIASLQLIFLEQGLHEDPVQYHARTSRIMNDLVGRDKRFSAESNHVLAVVVTHYIAGIKNLRIQEALNELTSRNELMSLQSLALQHRILQLADDYETALAKKLYHDDDGADIEQFISLLKQGALGPVDQSSKSPASVAQLNLNSSIARLIAKMRTLPDPSQTYIPRDRYKDHLEFPKTDIGIQCDINFSAHLALHNTRLLRCYSSTDPRVKPLILFIKYWVKLRAINTPYRGSLSSYGYVLMVLHYLTNIAMPCVCPNLQQLHRDPPSYLPPAEIAAQTTCNGYDVRFWRNEKEIASLSEQRVLNHNHDSLGTLLRGFFEYFSQTGPLSTGGRGFDWGREVLSLRTAGGILTKQEKGWIGARTVMETTIEAAPAPQYDIATPTVTSDTNKKSPTVDVATPRKLIVKEDVKEIRHRYLFAIEDPFELDHNVARTVTHNGIVSIRDEFRRAWRIVRSIGRPGQEGLLDEVVGDGVPKDGLHELLDLIYAKVVLADEAR